MDDYYSDRKMIDYKLCDNDAERLPVTQKYTTSSKI